MLLDSLDRAEYVLAPLGVAPDPVARGRLDERDRVGRRRRELERRQPRIGHV